MRLRRFAPFFVVMSLALVPFVLPARGAAPAASRTVDVEVVEIARDKSSHTLRVAVSLVDNDGASEVSTQAGTFRYFLKARRDRRAGRRRRSPRPCAESLTRPGRDATTFMIPGRFIAGPCHSGRLCAGPAGGNFV